MMERHDDAARLRAIIECQREIMACGPDRERVMVLITERVRALTCASTSIIELREDDQMVYRAAAGTAAGWIGTHLSLTGSLSGRAVLEERMLYCHDAELDTDVDLAACRRLGLRSLVVMPLRHGQKVIGVLKVAGPGVSAFSEEHLATLELMTGFLGAALAHAAEHESAQRAAEMFESAFSHAAVGMALVDLDGRWSRVNNALCQMLGYARSDLLKLDFQRITHPDDLAEDLVLVGRVLRGEINSYELEKRYLHRDGHVVFAHLGVSIVRDRDGGPSFFVVQVQDISRSKLAESEMKAFFDLSPNLLAIAGSTSFERVNSAWTRTLGWTAAELTSGRILDFVHPDDQQTTIDELGKLATNQPTLAFRNRYRTQDGGYRWLEWNARTADGRSYCDARDVTVLRAHEEREIASARALANSELRFRALSEGSIQGIVVAQLNGEGLLYVNDAAAKMFGYATSEDMRERATLFSLMPHHSRRLLSQDWNPFVAGERQSLSARIELQRIDGSPLWVNLLGSLISWDGTSALQTTMTDASAQLALEQALAQQASTDALTGLANRRQFERISCEACAFSERDASSLSLLILDLDHFKAINDRYGHAGGDEALCSFARTLDAVLLGRGRAGRWGGEEFVVLLPRTGLAAAVGIAEQIRVHWMNDEIHFENERFSGTVSIGVSERRAGERSFAEMLERADRALYEAKRGGRNTVRPSPVGFDSGSLSKLTTSRA